MKKIDDMVSDLIGMKLIDSNGRVVFTDEAKELIHNIAEKCNDFPADPKGEERLRKYSNGMTPEDVYIDMICKIACAPLPIFARATVRVLIPIIDQKLRNKIEDERKEGDE